MTLFEFLLCVLLIGSAAAISASEVALFSLSRFQLRSLKERFPDAYRVIKRLLADPGGLIITISVLNECLNIALSTLITEVLAGVWGSDSTWFERHLPRQVFEFIPIWGIQTVLGILITTPILLFFCEITPKVIGARANQLVAPLTSQGLWWVYRMFKPVRLVLKRVIRFISAMIGARGPASHEAGEKAPPLREEDFMVMVEEGHKEGAIEQSELELIKNVFELDDTTVQEVYTPLSKVFTLHEQTSLKNALIWLKDHKFFRIPITTSNRRHIVGVLYAKDLLRAKMDPALANSTVSELMHRPLTVNHSAKLNSVFRKLKQNKTHMAVVEDESGFATGIVTMDDVLDVLFDDLLATDEEELA